MGEQWTLTHIHNHNTQKYLTIYKFNLLPKFDIHGPNRMMGRIKQYYTNIDWLDME